MIKPFYTSCLLALTLLIPNQAKAEPTALQYQQILNDTLSASECCDSMKPDTNLGGIITTQTEVFYDKTTSLFFSRV